MTRSTLQISLLLSLHQSPPVTSVDKVNLANVPPGDDISHGSGNLIEQAADGEHAAEDGAQADGELPEGGRLTAFLPHLHLEAVNFVLEVDAGHAVGARIVVHHQRPLRHRVLVEAGAGRVVGGGVHLSAHHLQVVLVEGVGRAGHLLHAVQRTQPQQLQVVAEGEPLDAVRVVDG